MGYRAVLTERGVGGGREKRRGTGEKIDRKGEEKRVHEHSNKLRMGEQRGERVEDACGTKKTKSRNETETRDVFKSSDDECRDGRGKLKHEERIERTLCKRRQK